MTDPSGRSLMSMAEDVRRAMGRLHPGRPAFYALSHAHEALKDAARELDRHHRAHGPSGPPRG